MQCLIQSLFLCYTINFVKKYKVRHHIIILVRFEFDTCFNCNHLRWFLIAVSPSQRQFVWKNPPILVVLFDIRLYGLVLEKEKKKI